MLCLNLDEYGTKLEQLNILTQKMSSIDWTVDSVIQFCRDQGINLDGTIIDHIVVNDGRVTSITFKSGATHTFTYKT